MRGRVRWSVSVAMPPASTAVLSCSSPARHRRAATRPAAAEPRSEPRGPSSDALDEVSDAVEAGAGLPAVTRAAGRALDASVIVLDASSSVLAVACSSPEDERAVMAGEGGAETVELLVADTAVGQLRYRSRGEPPPPRRCCGWSRT